MVLPESEPEQSHQPRKKESKTMLGAVAHIGITVRDMEGALRFYRDLLGLKVLGDVTIAGDEADTLTREQGVKLRVVYLRSEKDVKGPPLELLHFVAPAGDGKAPYARLTNPGITEVAFWVRDIEKTYTELRERGVKFLSPPQLFELEGYGKAKAVYFHDPDGTTLELIQNV
jgi:catechol 2,3-dioxygenase-like lactoylglutathione lyase family enzyme